MPEVLRKYIPGQPEFLPFVKDLPKDTTSAKAKSKSGGTKQKVESLANEATERLKGLKT